MLDFEAALAVAEARVGAIPSEAADSIVACAKSDYDFADIGREARSAGNPAQPLVRRLRGAVSDEASQYVHWGATSQDVLDTASMLICRQALGLIVGYLDTVAASCAQLATAHRHTVVAGRTLLQQALPVTFGLKAAHWLAAIVDARRSLSVSLGQGLCLQLGGAAGTLAPLGTEGLAVLSALAQELGLTEPVVPWHTDRSPIAKVACNLAVACGAVEKVALDVILLAQTEVAEVAEAAGSGRGGSSTLPQKRNPIDAIRARACSAQARGCCQTLLGGMGQEHERAAGAWHSEWEQLRNALELSGGAACWIGQSLEGLEVNEGKMQHNLDASGGLLTAESVVYAVVASGGGSDAREAVTKACQRSFANGSPLRQELLSDPAISEVLSPSQLDSALDPSTYLGSTHAFIDRALSLYRGEVV
jgi:3-carboxy-cis,cis-muconate cycloisomerase